MPDLYEPTPPDRQNVRVRFMEAAVDIDQWVSYSFHSHLLNPTDGFSFTIAGDNLTPRQRAALVARAWVRLYVDQMPLADGFVDIIDIGADRSSGTVYEIEGRSRLGLTVDAGSDPTLSFKEGATLLDVMKGIFEPFGWVQIDAFSVDNQANRNAKTGGIRGIRTTKGGKKKGPRPLKDFVQHQLKPHNHEGAYQFASRIAERHGLRIWGSADGEQIIVAAPDYEQEPTYRLRRTLDGRGNIEGGRVRFDGTDQASIIIADGFSHSSEFGMSPIKAYCVNPYFGVDKDGFVLDEVSYLIKKYPNAQQVVMTVQPYTMRAIGEPMRPVYLHDDESKTQEQLNNFVRREMSLLLRKSLQCSYIVEGHGQTVGGIFVPWEIDTVVDVQDDIAGLHERLYIVGRSLEKSRSGGTHTRLELIRLHSLELGEPAEDAPKPKMKPASAAVPPPTPSKHVTEIR